MKKKGPVEPRGSNKSKKQAKRTGVEAESPNESSTNPGDDVIHSKELVSRGKLKTGTVTNVITNTNQQEDVSAYLAKGKMADFPEDLKPMLATLVDEPFNEPGWLYEVKWDGYRAVALMNKGKIELRSRNSKSFNDKFYPVVDALMKWGIDAVVDGEIVVITRNGVSKFGDLQQWRSEADGELVYYLFDLLWLNGIDLKGLPVTERRSILRAHLPPGGSIRMSENFDESGMDFFSMAKKMELEGIIAKRVTSLYSPGIRSKDWLKIKLKKRHEVVIGGYTQNEGSNRQFSALLVGFYENGELKFSGPVGTGFTNEMQTAFLKRSKPLITEKCPFSRIPDFNKPSRFRPNPPKASVTRLSGGEGG